MKKTNLAEKIGFGLIIIGFIALLFEDTFKDGPLRMIVENSMLINSIGLLIWALGYMKNQSEKKSNTETDD